jgi:phosphoglycolate phosphatase
MLRSAIVRRLATLLRLGMSMLNSLEAILFDLDGVIVDSRTPVARCINHALRRAGLAPESEPRLHARIGDPLHGVFTALLAERGADASQASECVAFYRELYREVSLSDTTLVPGVAELLAALAARRPLALATSKPLEFAVPILERLGVATHFAAHVGAPLVAGPPESKTDTARRALAALGLAPGAHAALVGDRHHDVSAARALRIGAIGVTWGIGSEAELREAGAEWLVATPAELARVLAL